MLSCLEFVKHFETAIAYAYTDTEIRIGMRPELSNIAEIRTEFNHATGLRRFIVTIERQDGRQARVVIPEMGAEND